MITFADQEFESFETLCYELVYGEKCGGPGSRRPGPCPGPKKPEPEQQPEQIAVAPEETDRPVARPGLSPQELAKVKKQAKDAIFESQETVKKGALDAKTKSKLGKASDYASLEKLKSEMNRIFYPGPSSQTPGQAIKPMSGIFAETFSAKTGMDLQQNAQILQGSGPTQGNEFQRSYAMAREIQKAAIRDPYYKSITSAYKNVFNRLMATGNPYAQGYDLFYG